MSRHLVIVGAGTAALSCAAKLRALSADIAITIIGDEPCAPYQRPPLSKAYLTGDLPLARLALRPAQWYADNQIRLRLNTCVVALDCAAHTLTLADGQSLTYDALLLATGACAKHLPAEVFDQGKVLRSIADADQLAASMQPGQQVLVLGGGYVGLEFAASARKKALAVSLVEAAPRILNRVAAALTADYFRALHQGQGVRIFEGVSVTAFTPQDGKTLVTLSDGQSLSVDWVVVGIGATPNDQLARAAGIACDDGILIDAAGRTSEARVYAAGDCARTAGQARIESVQNAIEQGEAVAYSLLNEPVPLRKTPWFWSDQYHAKLQIAGLNTGYDRVEVKSGTREGAQSVWYYQGQRLLAVDAINDPVTYMTVRRQLDTK